MPSDLTLKKQLLKLAGKEKWFITLCGSRSVSSSEESLSSSPAFPKLGNRIRKKWTRGRWSPIGFFNPVIRTPNFVQSRNPDGYFWHPTSRAYFQSRKSPQLCFKISNPGELQIREIPGPEKTIKDPRGRVMICNKALNPPNPHYTGFTVKWEWTRWFI